MPCLTKEQLCLLGKADIYIQAKGCRMPDDEVCPVKGLARCIRFLIPEWTDAIAEISRR
jgi:hypothetical protein